MKSFYVKEVTTQLSYNNILIKKELIKRNIELNKAWEKSTFGQ